MSGTPDRERAALAEIEKELSAQYPRLARRLRRPNWFIGLLRGQYGMFIYVGIFFTVLGTFELIRLG